ncbi:MAG: hypothetical protein HY842_13070 [Bacteroidetes bacterium]|nr:hypothetical protein [Bacteroidota bacterium]
MRNLLYALLYLILSSCSQAEPQENYPDAIKKYHLERQFDLAKWELYKINSITSNENSTDFVVSLQSDSVLDRFFIEKRIYQSQGKNLLKDRKRLIELFGESRIARYPNCELDFLPEDVDSSTLFEGDEIYLSFFPKFKGYENYPVYKLEGGLCATIIFEGDQIKRIGCNDYLEWDYEGKYYPDSIFQEIIEKHKKEISPWLLNEYKRRLKSEK